MLRSYTYLAQKYKHGSEKVRFATSKDQRNEILAEIRIKIQRLERILTASNQVAAFEKRENLTVSRQSVNHLLGYWKHADRIFALLSSSLVCSCRQTHRANLWLQHPTSAHLEFRMLVMFAPTNSDPSLVAPWQQLDLKIELASLKGPVAKQTVNSALLSPPQRLVMRPAIAEQRLRSDISSQYGKASRPVEESIRYS